MPNKKAILTDADKAVIEYLSREIDWNRRAGRLLLGFIVAWLLSLLLVVFRPQPDIDLITLIIAVPVNLFAAIVYFVVLLMTSLLFNTYFRRTATQKNKLQSVIEAGGYSEDISKHFKDAVQAEGWHLLRDLKTSIRYLLRRTG